MDSRVVAENMQRSYAEAVEEFKKVDSQMQKLVEPRPSLMSQLQEISMVQSELELCGDDENVFKLVGPVLVRQELDEAKMNVKKRFEFTKQSLDRIEAGEKDLTEKRGKLRDKIMSLQQLLGKMQAAIQAEQAKAAGGGR